VTTSEVAWAIGRRTMGWPTRLLVRIRTYGVGRVPPTGGLVYASNHMHWIDIPVIGISSPRNIDFVAKVEAARFPGLGRYLRWHGTISVRRGQSDRDAVRMMKQSARDGHVVGLFVEGTRLHLGRPGPAQPGAAMVALQEDVPVMPVVIYGSQFWKIGNFAPVAVAYGSPVRFDGLPKNGRGYKEATVEIERRINVLFDWLADLHGRGYPPGLEPPL
jgi:1-acyl-sn-glycerol-3-phosphate acyltransferase